MFFVLGGERKGEAKRNIEREIKVKRKIDIEGQKIKVKISFYHGLRTYKKYRIQTKY